MNYLKRKDCLSKTKNRKVKQILGDGTSGRGRI
jgi:hypothetical protein